MAFTNYGSGNWLGLPEFGISENIKEFFSGLTGQPVDSSSYNSIYNAQQKTNSTVPSTYGTSSTVPSLIEDTHYTYKPSGGSIYQTVSTPTGTQNLYSKSAAAESLGVSKEQLERMARDAGYDSTEEFMQNYNPQINNIYNEANSILNQQEQRLRSGEQDYYNTFTAPYDSQIPLVNQAKQEGIANLQNQQNVAEYQEKSALDAANRLYNELTARNRQAFGGTSSIGQAASEILGREQQRQLGSIKNNSAQVVQGIISKINDTESKASAMLQQLQKEKEAALSQAKLAFQDKLDAIDSDRFALAQQKSQMKYQEMLAYRDRVQALQDRATEYSMQIEAMREQARLESRGYLDQVNAMNQSYGGQAAQGNQNLSQANQNAISTLGFTSGLNGVSGGASSNILSPTGYSPYTSTVGKKNLLEEKTGGGSW